MKVLMIGMGMVAQTLVLALRDTAADLRLCAVLGRNASRAEHFAQKVTKDLGYPTRLQAAPPGRTRWGTRPTWRWC